MRALILSTHTGGGHDAAALAMQEALEEKGVTCEFLDSVAFGGERFSGAVSQLYIRTVIRHPGAFGKAYRIADVVRKSPLPSPVYLVNASYARRMAGEIAAFGPDMVVCTHLFAGQSLTYLRRRGLYNGVLGMVQTDYTFIPFSEEVKADLYFVGHADILSECAKRGIDSSKVHVTGIPVHPGCQRRPYESHNPLRVVLAGGSMGAGDLPETVRLLLTLLPENVRLQVVAGNNEDARSRVEAITAGDRRTEVFGRVSPLSDLMRDADLLITKSGGLTITEAMVIGVPLLIYQAIEGCETINADLLERHGLGLYARDAAALKTLLPRVLASPEMRDKMIRNQFEQIPPEPARTAADLMIREVKHV